MCLTDREWDSSRHESALREIASDEAPCCVVSRVFPERRQCPHEIARKALQPITPQEGS